MHMDCRPSKPSVATYICQGAKSVGKLKDFTCAAVPQLHSCAYVMDSPLLAAGRRM